MKKEEAKLIAKERAKLINEYILQILLSNANGKITLGKAKLEGEMFCTIDIEVPESHFERHFNSGIAHNHKGVFYQAVLESLIEEIVNQNNILLGRFESQINRGLLFDGIRINNLNDNELLIEFTDIHMLPNELIDKYNTSLEEWVKKL